MMTERAAEEDFNNFELAKTGKVDFNRVSDPRKYLNDMGYIKMSQTRLHSPDIPRHRTETNATLVHDYLNSK